MIEIFQVIIFKTTMKQIQ